ncbi:hypothetical protein LWI29_038127 [Acer saccharum]|uniref:Formin-like protein n=1 Tax=Acer saccharum TaxID=4024 RepID=A0AA39W5B2_ACESA|nr:hypothetical protein LWI29_038127 [Acer saccharum]
MGVIKASCFIFMVVLLCGSLVISSGHRRRAEEAFLSKLVDPVTGEVDEDLAKLLWISCRVDLIHLKQVFKDLNFCLTEETLGSTNENNLRSQSWEENINKLDNVLHPHLKRTLLDCIRNSNLLFHITREEGGSHFTSHIEPLFPRPDAPRRNLGSRSSRSTAEIQNPVSAPAPAPVSAPVPAPAPVDASFHSPPPVRAPAPPFFQVFSPPSIDEGSSTPSGSVAEEQANGNNNNHKAVVIAVAVTASVTFVAAAVLFFCCMKFCRSGSAVRQNDERPLLSLSMNDYSIGSGNSIKGEKLGHQSFGINSSHDIKASSLVGNLDSNTSLDESASLGAVGGRVGPPLKPPPGRIGATPSGRPPLKPPPGRVEPLPHEPPSFLRASASSTGPPPAPVLPPHPPPVPPPPPMKPSGGAGPPPPRPPPPPTPGARPGPPPPPLPKKGPPPPRPPPPMLGSKGPRPPLGPKHPSNTASSEGVGTERDAEPKAKLKPFFWDKVLANPDNSMVWHQIKSGSFQFNEEMIETLFGYAATDKNKTERKKESSSLDQGPQYIQIIDSKKSQNLAIMLRALNVTIEEVCDALLEGNELPVEFLQALLKMAPTPDEELKLRLFSGEISQLGSADRFLKVLGDIPFAFKRIEALLFMCTLQEEVTFTKESFETLEVACKELRNSRLFHKLLEAVLKTGNRMNDGTFRGGAQAFKLDTLLKLADVKGVDGKTTLLHFVVQEISRTEGVRATRAMRESQSFSSVKTDELLEEVSHETEDHYRNLGLQVLSRLSSELENVKKAAALDAEGLTGSVAKLNYSLLKARNFLNSDMNSLEEDSGFHETLKSFVQNAEVDIKWLVAEEKRIMGLVKSTGDYFHGNAGKDEGLRLFVIVRDFLIILDKVCREVREAPRKPAKAPKKESSNAPSSSDTRQQPHIDPRQKLFHAIAERRMDDSGSDEDT